MTFGTSVCTSRQKVHGTRGLHLLGTSQSLLKTAIKLPALTMEQKKDGSIQDNYSLMLEKSKHRFPCTPWYSPVISYCQQANDLIVVVFVTLIQIIVSLTYVQVYSFYDLSLA
jgi:hypothetical protein